MQWHFFNSENENYIICDAVNNYYPNENYYFEFPDIELPSELADAINDLFHKINGRKYNADNNTPSASDTENNESRSALYKLVLDVTIALMMFVVWFLLPGYEETHQWWFHWIAKIVYTMTSVSAAKLAAKSVG